MGIAHYPVMIREAVAGGRASDIRGAPPGLCLQLSQVLLLETLSQLCGSLGSAGWPIHSVGCWFSLQSRRSSPGLDVQGDSLSCVTARGRSWDSWTSLSLMWPQSFSFSTVWSLQQGDPSHGCLGLPRAEAARSFKALAKNRHKVPSITSSWLTGIPGQPYSM